MISNENTIQIGVFLLSRYITDLVNDLVNSLNTNNPYEIADVLGFFVTERELPSTIDGDRIIIDYLNETHIILNKQLEENKRMFVCAHELGHCLLHEENSQFFIEYSTYQVLGRYEREANEFATKLLAFYRLTEKIYDTTTESITQECAIPYNMQIFIKFSQP